MIEYNKRNEIKEKTMATTAIDLTYGERWFCTEEEAIRNGWNKAPR